MRLLHEVPSAEFSKAVRTGRGAATVILAEQQALEQRLATFDAQVLALKTVRPGDVVDHALDPASGLQLRLNGQPRGAPIAGQDFYAAVLRTCLGDRPYDVKLKTGRDRPPGMINDPFSDPHQNWRPLLRRTLLVHPVRPRGPDHATAAGTGAGLPQQACPAGRSLRTRRHHRHHRARGQPNASMARSARRHDRREQGRRRWFHRRATTPPRPTPDGYMLGMATVSTTAANPAINPNASAYNPTHRLHTHHQHRGDTQRDRRAPQLSRRATTRASSPSLKKSPGKYSFASSGTGGIGHLQTELFKSLAGVFITHIPYRGAGPALNDTVAGQVQIIFDNIPSALPFIKRQAADRRSWWPRHSAWRQLPDVPTFKEVGLEPVNRMAYYGMLRAQGPAEGGGGQDQRRGSRRTVELAGGEESASRTPARMLILANSPDEFAAPDPRRVRRVQEGRRRPAVDARIGGSCGR